MFFTKVNGYKVVPIFQVSVLIRNQQLSCLTAHEYVLKSLAPVKTAHVVVMHVRLHSIRPTVGIAVANDVWTQRDRSVFVDINYERRQLLGSLPQMTDRTFCSSRCLPILFISVWKSSPPTKVKNSGPRRPTALTIPSSSVAAVMSLFLLA